MYDSSIFEIQIYFLYYMKKLISSYIVKRFSRSIEAMYIGFIILNIFSILSLRSGAHQYSAAASRCECGGKDAPQLLTKKCANAHQRGAVAVRFVDFAT